ncbi:TAXI family TRAP transporter solute-binding subunit [Stutzerimonas azotifigens]|uniref:TAXI family TRAP transporter solute-binding subunit n=1 Tax=Stutzerimonas azotifigens TaxID=291995 RepID=UPI0003FA19BD|nr:TAXI family TRAP transporter solute-binding subunit [Stutzerimonas azotifigens]
MIKTAIATLTLALAAQAHAADRADWPQTLVIGTGSPGAVYGIYGQGVAGVISRHVGVPASTQQTQGPNQNLVLLHKGRIDIAMSTMGPAYEAWTGELDLHPGTRYENMRAVLPMYNTAFQVAALERTGIKSVSDLDGKVLGTGPKGGTGSYWKRWLDILGIEVTERNGPLGDQASQLADGRLDAVATAAGLPTSAFSELEAQVPATVFSFSQEQIDQLLPKLPYASITEIPAGTYQSLKVPIKTLGMWNFVIVDHEMPEDLVYEITKAVLEHPDEMVNTHASAKETLAENVLKNDFLPLHPGAVRYYRERGIDIPDKLLPPEMKQ